MEGNLGEPTVMGAPPFSSPDPATDAKRMLPLEDGTSAHQARLDVEGTRTEGDYKGMSPAELKALTEERDLAVEGTGKGGAVKKNDYIAALQEDDAADMKAADFKEQVEAAENQDALDEIAQLYDNSGKSYSTVEAAIEKKQAELDEQGNN